MFKTLRLGMRYLEIWPDEPVLGAIYRENRVRYVLNAAKYLIPPFIFFILIWNFIQGGGLKGVDFLYTQRINWPMSVICILFLLALPLQGYYWAGKRAQTELNVKEKEFYVSLCKRLDRTPAEKPVFMDLALILKEGLTKLGREILNEL